MVGHVSNFQKLSKTRRCGTGTAMIQTDDQMLRHPAFAETLSVVVDSSARG